MPMSVGELNSSIYSPPSERDPASPALATDLAPRTNETTNMEAGQSGARPMDLGREEGEGREDEALTRTNRSEGSARRYINQPVTVHLIMPIHDRIVPAHLRRGFRPDHPYPFTGQVMAVHEAQVRRGLELLWRQEAAGLSDATDRGVAAVMQMRALWMWENGWRLSRTDATWGYYGDSADEDFQGHLNAQSQVTGPLREEAERRLRSLRRSEEEMAREGRGQVRCEWLARLIWDSLQTIRRAYRDLGLGEIDAWFRDNSHNPVHANGPHGLVNQVNNLPGPSQQGGSEPMINLGPLPLQVEGHQAINRRLEENLDYRQYLEQQAERYVANANRILAIAQDANLEHARARAMDEIAVGQANLQRERARRIEAEEARDRARRAAVRQGVQLADVIGEVPRQEGGGRGRGNRGGWGRGRKNRGRRGNRGGNRGGSRERAQGNQGEGHRLPEARDEIRGDAWRIMLSQRANSPAMFEWRRRVRVMELQLLETHPERDHIRRVLESEEAAAVTDAKALIRSQELTGAHTMFDISWPLSKSVTVKFGKPGRDVADTESETDEEERKGRYYGAVPPPNCGFYRGFGGRGRGGRGGQGGANQVGF